MSHLPIRLANSLSQLNAARLTLGSERQERAHYLQQIGTPSEAGGILSGAAGSLPAPLEAPESGAGRPAKAAPSVPAARSLPPLRARGGTPPPGGGAGWEHKQAEAGRRRFVEDVQLASVAA